MNRELSEFVIFDSVKQVVKADQAERVMTIINHDLNEFNRFKQYALENMDYLYGKKILIEVDAISHLTSHNCMIINDLVLMSYTEVAEMIMDMKEREENAKRKLRAVADPE